MKKKIIIGSIIAVVILVLVSFNSVVGYQRVKSTFINETSPLFTIRTNRAIGKESKGLSGNYASKENTLPFPKQDDITVLIHKIVESINKMDYGTFEKYIDYIINKLQRNKEFNDVNPDIIREVLYLRRYSDKSIPEINTKSENITFGNEFKGLLVNTFSEPLCFIKLILVSIAVLLLKIICAFIPDPVGSVIVCPPPRTI